MKTVWHNMNGMAFLLVLTFLFTGFQINADSRQPLEAYPYEAGTDQTLQYGRLSGLHDENSGTFSWLGVPYAQAPVGDLRWKAPQKLQPWDGIKEAKEFSDVCLQLSFGQLLGSEDCLYLNIWRPDTKEENLPVMLFLHGGGNTTGSSKSFPGKILAKQTNSIIISINYRLNSLGWFNYSALKTGDKLDDSGNFGLLDAIQALSWVKENIRSFGGDASNVTISGQSAGARDSLALLISPQASGLFAKAMPLSGGMTLATREMGEEAAHRLVLDLAVTTGKASDEEDAGIWVKNQAPSTIAQWLRSLPPEVIVKATQTPSIKMNGFPHLFRDGYVIPEEGYERFRTGKYNQVPILLGSCQNEFALFALFDPHLGMNITEIQKAADPSKLNILRNANNYGSRLYAGFNTDSIADLLMDADGQPSVYAYRFAWSRKASVVTEPFNWIIGPTHGTDMDFIMGQETSFLNQIYPGVFYNEDNKGGRDALSTLMQSYIRNFLYTGNPNDGNLPEWDSWTKEEGKKRILLLDADTDKASATMSDVHLIKDQILKEMQDELSDDDLTQLDMILEGRFFME